MNLYSKIMNLYKEMELGWCVTHPPREGDKVFICMAFYTKERFGTVVAHTYGAHWKIKFDDGSEGNPQRINFIIVPTKEVEQELRNILAKEEEKT